jgi:hypothetical protein
MPSFGVGQVLQLPLTQGKCQISTNESCRNSRGIQCSALQHAMLPSGEEDKNAESYCCRSTSNGLQIATRQDDMFAALPIGLQDGGMLNTISKESNAPCRG